MYAPSVAEQRQYLIECIVQRNFGKQTITDMGLRNITGATLHAVKRSQGPNQHRAVQPAGAARDGVARNATFTMDCSPRVIWVYRANLSVCAVIVQNHGQICNGFFERAWSGSGNVDVHEEVRCTNCPGQCHRKLHALVWPLPVNLAGFPVFF